MRNAVFIHTNPKQIVGALVAQHALRSHSAAPERFDVRILQTTDFPAFERFEGRRYLREGQQVPWRNDDLIARVEAAIAKHLRPVAGAAAIPTTPHRLLGDSPPFSPHVTSSAASHRRPRACSSRAPPAAAATLLPRRSTRALLMLRLRL